MNPILRNRVRMTRQPRLNGAPAESRRQARLPAPHERTVALLLKTLGWFSVTSILWSQTSVVYSPELRLRAAGSPAAGLTLQEALESTLRRHPLGRIGEQQVLASRGVQREASGIFDPVIPAG